MRVAVAQSAPCRAHSLAPACFASITRADELVEIPFGSFIWFSIAGDMFAGESPVKGAGAPSGSNWCRWMQLSVIRNLQSGPVR